MVPRQVVFAAVAFRFCTRTESAFRTRLALTMLSGAFRPRTCACTERNCAVPSALGGVRSVHEPASVRSSVELPSAATAGTGMPISRADCSNCLSPASPRTATWYPAERERSLGAQGNRAAQNQVHGANLKLGIGEGQRFRDEAEFCAT